ncbi:hypothetical protein Cst_c12030 [Thermoclostridium stercorarium subsp. stercorarium DSM 8532]|jgi:hypothetical protein|uniref:Uncharacterized protein n=3 Tax=Thermoclostridium stercorarium TaxID=1510 RepID=L7VRL7_THES1|nr:DUF5711 family protein [Thermoclostridium stercorarium]AGC68198.1 hypothetical protein Cst_c12030 [Thermoclostridium stercorarium subsp. stercorarium DSM 8532]AGI39226.1 PQQ-like domain-containing protein [Thermoclostridium stercorarium subsp. stercorarium DSM 8532]ANW98570.1 hypothetical protein CSTERTH_05720 [Thermoclostridium stercorarium subsp. thermolacticum DSM 2910]ANX01108.1 hypothetical protein CSTERLE_05710 [Thermoclostridium stercorarium subsp. leptospartum DSM 9219]UZQ86725.1 DU
MTKERTVKPVKIALKILILIILISVILSAVLISMDENDINFDWSTLNLKAVAEKLHIENSINQAKNISFDDLDISRTAEYDGNLLVLTNYDIRLISPEGEEIWYYTHEVRHPVLNISGQWILVYEKNGKSYMVIKDGKVVLKETLDEEIAFGEATERYILFITAGNNGYKRTLQFVSPETGLSLGAMYIDDYYPYYFKTLNSGNSFILYGLGMNSTDISTIIRIYESSGKTAPLANVEIEGLYPVMYGNGSRYVFVGDYRLFCYNSDLELLWSQKYTDNIAAAGLFENNAVVVALNGEKKMIKFYNSNGDETKSIETRNNVQSIVTYKNTAAVVFGSKVTFYDSSGKVIGEASMPGLSMDVHFVNTGQAFLVTEHEAVLYNISGR